MINSIIFIINHTVVTLASARKVVPVAKPALAFAVETLASAPPDDPSATSIEPVVTTNAPIAMV